MNKPLIDYQLQRLMVGAVGLALGIATEFLTKEDLTSISASYHAETKDFLPLQARDLFVGALCFIGAFLFVYRGHSEENKFINEALLSKVAGTAAIVVAFVPTAKDPNGSAPLHYIAAAIVFLVLTYFCIFSFRKHALRKGTRVAKNRALIYSACGAVMIVGILMIVTHSLLGFPAHENTVFWGETVALVAFGVAWITAGKLIIAESSERLKLRDFWG